MERTHTCSQLRIENNKEEIQLIGWVQRIRDHGGKKFIDLRDRDGITQIVFDPDVTQEFESVEEFRREYLIQIKGTVRPRPEGTINQKHPTGEIEVLVTSHSLINSSDVLPFDLDEEHFKDVNEELRLEYRYLDLRRPEMINSFRRRHKFISKLRNFLDEQEFIEVETPFLTKSTPEGARDMLVPSRKHDGSFYALPQSPQLFKQLLMVSGFEKYYQIVKCFRDEDSRKDRQLEFTQIDLEMSFIEWEEFKTLMESSLIEAMKVYDKQLTHDNFTTLSYDEAVGKFGSDKPDLRIQGLELVDITELSKNCGFSVFNNTANQDGLVKGMCVKQGQKHYSRKQIDKLIEFSQIHGAKGMAWMKVLSGGEIESSISKFFTDTELSNIRESLNGEEGDYLFFIADNKDTTNEVLDALRRKIAEELNLIDTTKDSFAWVIDFPLFKWDADNQKIDAEHSPFTMPNEEGVKFLNEKINSKEDIKNNTQKLLSIKADCYDLAFNGFEICSGAKRIHIPELQKKVFDIIELSEEEIEAQFGWFLKAYNYGAPSHRGLAYGVDRIIMLLENKSSIREVMAFPKNKTGYCPLTHSPSPVTEQQLRDLHIKLRNEKKKK